MRTLIIVFVTCLSISLSYSQEIVVQSIGPAASGFNQSGASLAYTVGELVIEPSYGDTVSVGSGLVYLVDTVAFTATLNLAGLDLGIVLFPNPTIDKLNIQLTDLLFEPTIGLYSLSGGLLQQINVAGRDHVRVDFSQYASGYYLLIVKHPEQGTVATYKIQKN